MRRSLLLLTMLCLSGLIRGEVADTCFTINNLPDTVFQFMQGRSYPKGCPIPRSELRYLQLSYHDAQGITRQGEIVCNKLIADDLVDIFRELWKKGYRIERMRLVDHYEADDQRSMEANNTSCFCFRTISGSKVISKHGQGMAIDINPLYNPYVKNNAVEPRSGKQWAYRRAQRKDIPYKIDNNDLCYKLFIQHGFKWGGDWKNCKDYQHFEK